MFLISTLHQKGDFDAKKLIFSIPPPHLLIFHGVVHVAMRFYRLYWVNECNKFGILKTD